jgi:hypothetical protein
MIRGDSQTTKDPTIWVKTKPCQRPIEEKVSLQANKQMNYVRSIRSRGTINYGPARNSTQRSISRNKKFQKVASIAP